MKVLLKFHSTLTGGVDDKIKNLKPLKQIMINITICRSKPHLRIFLLKIPPYPHGLSGCVEIVINFKISHA